MSTKKAIFQTYLTNECLFGAWLGDAGPLVLDSGTPCELRKSNNDKVVWSGTLELRHTANSAGEGLTTSMNLVKRYTSVTLEITSAKDRITSRFLNTDEATTLTLQKMFSIARLQSRCMVYSGSALVSDWKTLGLDKKGIGHSVYPFKSRTWTTK